MDIDSNVIERAAEAACRAWMKTDLGIAMPDRTPADYDLDSQEWCDFWQRLGIERRDVFRAQAEAALRAVSGVSIYRADASDSELSPQAQAAVPEIAAWLERLAPTLRGKTAQQDVGAAAMLLKREVTGEI